MEPTEQTSKSDAQLPSESPNVIHATLDDLRHENFERFIMNHEKVGYEMGFLKILPPTQFWTDIQIHDDEDTRLIPKPTRQRSIMKTAKLFLFEAPDGTLKYRRRDHKGSDTKRPRLDQEEEMKVVNKTKITYYIQDIDDEVPSMTLPEYRKRAEERQSRKPSRRTSAKMWRKLGKSKAIYGDSIPGTRCRYHSPYWCPPKLQTLLNAICSRIGEVMPGINTSYLYYGDWMTTFCWHVEDLLLFSMSYLHDGADKIWYIVPPGAREEFEKFFMEICPEDFNGQPHSCPNYIHHKRFLFNPKQLKKVRIPCTEVVQKKGEIMITFPGAYHCGLNCGFNCAEALNFAMPSWLPYGLQAKVCDHNPEAMSFTAEMKRVAKSIAVHINPIMSQDERVTESIENPATIDDIIQFLLEQDPMQLLPVPMAVTNGGRRETFPSFNPDPVHGSDTRMPITDEPSEAISIGTENMFMPVPAKQVNETGGPEDCSDILEQTVENRRHKTGPRTSQSFEERVKKIFGKTYGPLTFGNSYSFKTPIQEAELEGKPPYNVHRTGYECLDCGRMYKRRKDCEFHIKEKHKGEKTKKKPVRCSHCHCTFYNNGSLQAHIRRLEKRGIHGATAVPLSSPRPSLESQNGSQPPSQHHKNYLSDHHASSPIQNKIACPQIPNHQPQSKANDAILNNPPPTIQTQIGIAHGSRYLAKKWNDLPPHMHVQNNNTDYFTLPNNLKWGTVNDQLLNVVSTVVPKKINFADVSQLVG